VDHRIRSSTRLSGAALAVMVFLVGACTTASVSATASAPAPSSSATQAASAATAAAPPSSAAATSGGTSGTCKYLSDIDAATLLPTAGQAKVTGADTPAGTVTSCHWGTGNLVTKANVVQLVVDEFKIDVALVAAKKSLAANVKTPIAGLGDGGGFSEQSSDIISIDFFKGNRTVQLVVAAPGMTPAAVSALAQKVEANL
jgi:hypothetical protein